MRGVRVYRLRSKACQPPRSCTISRAPACPKSGDGQSHTVLFSTDIVPFRLVRIPDPIPHPQGRGFADSCMLQSLIAVIVVVHYLWDGNVVHEDSDTAASGGGRAIQLHFDRRVAHGRHRRARNVDPGFRDVVYWCVGVNEIFACVEKGVCSKLGRVRSHECLHATHCGR